MFFQRKRLVCTNLSGFDTSKVTTMEDMFSRCNKITNLNLSSFTTANVTSMKDMFYRMPDL